MVIRPAVLGTAAVLSASLLAPATIASAAVASPPSRHSASSSAGAIADVTQQQVRLGTLHYVRVAVAVSAPTVVHLADPSGEVVEAEDATPEHPAVFQVKPNGDDTARYTVRDGASERTVDVDFRGLGLSAPVALLNDREIDRLRHAAAAGHLDQQIRYRVVPGAELTVIANGHTSTSVADASGIAVADVHFVIGENALTELQTLNGKSSDVEVSHYLLDVDGSGGDDGATVPSDPAFGIDVDRTTPVEAVDGKVTITGTATRGEVTVSSGRGEALTTVPVQDGRWSATVPVDSQRVLALRFELRPSTDGPVSDRIEAPIVVLSAPETPFGLTARASYDRHDGRVHLAGTAPSGEVTVFRSRERLGTTTTADGTWEIDVPLAVGHHGLRFVFQPEGSGSTQEKTALVNVVD